jgi:hypothetical protein
LKERDHLGDLGVSGRIKLKIKLKELRWASGDLIHFAWDMDQWQALVNTVMNLPIL